jgi:hypothetical protein
MIQTSEAYVWVIGTVVWNVRTLTYFWACTLLESSTLSEMRNVFAPHVFMRL